MMLFGRAGGFSGPPLANMPGEAGVSLHLAASGRVAGKTRVAGAADDGNVEDSVAHAASFPCRASMMRFTTSTKP